MDIQTTDTAPSITVEFFDDSGLPLTGKVAADFPTVYYAIEGANANVSITLADLSLITSAYSSGGIKERAAGSVPSRPANGGDRHSKQADCRVRLFDGQKHSRLLFGQFKNLHRSDSGLREADHPVWNMLCRVIVNGNNPNGTWCGQHAEWGVVPHHRRNGSWPISTHDHGLREFDEGGDVRPWVGNESRRDDDIHHSCRTACSVHVEYVDAGFSRRAASIGQRCHNDHKRRAGRQFVEDRQHGSDRRDLGASVLLSPGTGVGQLDITSGVTKANTTHVSGTAQTARDLGASVLLSVGTSTGQVNLSSGKVPATIAAGDIATDAITAAALKADAVTEIQTGLATEANVTAIGTAVYDRIGANGAGLTSVTLADGSITPSTLLPNTAR